MTTSLLATLWRALGDDAPPLPPIELTGAPGGLPSVYAVSELAVASVAVATAAVADLVATRAGELVRAARVDRQHAVAAFRSERFVEPIGWALPPVWDPLAGDYRTADGWIRIHTNYASHRAAALRALGLADATREAAARVTARCAGEALEAAIVREGGAAAVMRTAAAWTAHPQGVAVAAEPLVATRVTPAPPCARAPTGPGLAGVRVLDLTRVIAGPVCTRLLAAYGAEVLRIDPPGFAEVPALLPETTAGKRRAALDLRAAADRARFAALVADADLLVCGYRSAALARLGFDEAALRARNPGLAIVTLDAYGWTGPWADRRGFDSLVQMSSGIAARCAEAAGSEAPGALPAQALDHAAGYLLAAAACRALARRHAGAATTARLSLARIAHELASLGDAGDPRAPALATGDPFRERASSSFGPLFRVRPPGELAGLAPRWSIAPGPLGSDPPVWAAS